MHKFHYVLPRSRLNLGHKFFAQRPYLIILFFVVSTRTSQAQNTTVEVGKPLLPVSSQVPSLQNGNLISPEHQRADEKFSSCAAQNSTERVSNLLQLSLLQTRIEDRFGSLSAEAIRDEKMSDARYEATLQSLWEQSVLELDNLSTKLQGNLDMKMLALAEIARTQSDLAVRLAVSALGAPAPRQKALIEKYMNLAEVWSQKALNRLNFVSPQTREKIAPGMLARCATTRLYTEQVRMMQGDLGNTKKFEGFAQSIKPYESVAGGEAEKQYLRIIKAEAWNSLAKGNAGQMAMSISVSSSQQKEYQSLTREIQTAAPTLQDPALKEQSLILGEELPFMGAGGLVGRDDGLKSATTRLQSGSPAEKDILRKALTEVAHNNVGTAFAEDIFKAADKSDPVLKENLAEIKSRHQAVGEEYDSTIRQAIGNENYKKLGFASFNDLMKSHGALYSLQQDYAEELAAFAKLGEAYKKKPNKNLEAELQSSTSLLDIEWARIQCHRHRMGSRLDFNPKVEAPFKTFTIDISKCGMPNISTYDSNTTNGYVNEMLSTAIGSKLHKELAWIAGDFAFDVASLLATGGAATIVKAGIKSGIKTGAKTLLKRELLNPTLVKTAARGTSFVAQGVAIDLASQSVGASRSLLEAGFKGDWNGRNFTDNFSYTKKDLSVGQHLLRVTATAFAAKGMEKLWGLGRKVPSLSQSSEFSVKKIAVGTAQATASVMIAAQVNPIVDKTLGKNNAPLTDSLGKLTSGQEWLKSMGLAIQGQLKGKLAEKSDGDSKLRYFGTGLAAAAAPLNFTQQEVAQLKELEKCFVEPIKAPTQASAPETPTPAPAGNHDGGAASGAAAPTNPQE